MANWTIKGRWVFPISGPPISDGVVTIDGERIAAVGPAGESSIDVDLGDAAILPGLVNAHTHLDLSGMRGLAPPSPDFTGWLRQVIAHRRARTAEQVQQDIEQGIAECIRNGTVLVGDITATGQSWSSLVVAPLRSIAFYEVLGLPIDRTIEVAGNAAAWLDQREDTANCRPGISPHAPYSTAQMLYAWAATVANGFRLPLATHLAETQAELELLEKHSGPFKTFLSELGVWTPKALHPRPSNYTRMLRVVSGPVLLIHCNFLAPSVRLPKRASVIYCPRTHAAFGHPPHPFREFLARGVRVALGTDSFASNPDLDLLAEAKFVHQRYPDFPGDTLLRMATLSGAEALCWEDETGSLDPGKSADLIVVPLSASENDPHRLVLESTHPVRAVLFRGRWVHDARGELTAPFAG
jgi:cytosine/adenosine deaminase-related metal-dependent hydrolase